MANIRTHRVPECAACTALCCRVSVIPLDPHYAWDRAIIAAGAGTDGAIPETDGTVRVGPVIARQASGSCVYLDESTSRCTIYALRPVVCRSWGCLSRQDALRLTAQAVEAGIDPRGAPPLAFLRRTAPAGYRFVAGWARRRFGKAAGGP
ncbi:MAG TPA: YkgJ family cysteine cluster protein [bacterium]|nr:YkgJ family cysteine cluster protein [bacterium]